MTEQTLKGLEDDFNHKCRMIKELVTQHGMTYSEISRMAAYLASQEHPEPSHPSSTSPEGLVIVTKPGIKRHTKNLSNIYY